MPDRAVDDDLDQDDRVLPAIGPGHRQNATGPIDAVYADGAIHRPCTECGAQNLEYCRWPDGTLRRLPHHTR